MQKRVDVITDGVTTCIYNGWIYIGRIPAICRCGTSQRRAGFARTRLLSGRRFPSCRGPTRRSSFFPSSPSPAACKTTLEMIYRGRMSGVMMMMSERWFQSWVSEWTDVRDDVRDYVGRGARASIFSKKHQYRKNEFSKKSVQVRTSLS